MKRARTKKHLTPRTTKAWGVKATLFGRADGVPFLAPKRGEWVWWYDADAQAWRAGVVNGRATYKNRRELRGMFSIMDFSGAPGNPMRWLPLNRLRSMSRPKNAPSRYTSEQASRWLEIAWRKWRLFQSRG